jgi:ATP-dependent RNA helicase SUPV3L1/SUV3
MLSITGLTLEQFARLMEGMGYRAEQGTRPKVRPAPAAEAPKVEDAAVAEPAAADGAAGEPADEAAAPAETEAEALAGTGGRDRCARGGGSDRCRR